MNTLKPVRLKSAWGGYAKGRTFDAMPAGQAQVLIARGLAEYVVEVPKAPVFDRMMRGRGKK